MNSPTGATEDGKGMSNSPTGATEDGKGMSGGMKTGAGAIWDGAWVLLSRLLPSELRDPVAAEKSKLEPEIARKLPKL